MMLRASRGLIYSAKRGANPLRGLAIDMEAWVEIGRLFDGMVLVKITPLLARWRG